MAIVKISARGDNPGGLIRYLFGKGNANEHVNQRTVAGPAHYEGPYDRELINQITNDMRAYARTNPQTEVKGGHVWHASIALKPGESLTDDRWRSLASDYMREMGFEDPAKAPIRWVAVNHGLNTSGSDHIHIVMSMIRQDGSKVRIHNDAITSSRVMAQLEQKYGLSVIEGRGSRAAPRTFTGPEKNKSMITGNEIERQELERSIRALASASASEAEFVRQARKAGLEIRPRVDGTGQVTGYSVGIPGSGVHFAGGKIARDLTLPRLRQRWAETDTGIKAAQQEWVHGKPNAPLVKHGRETRLKNTAVLPKDVQAELHAFEKQLTNATDEQLMEAAADLAGVQALAAAHDPSFAAMSRETGRRAQTKSYGPRHKQSLMNTGLLLLMMSDPNSQMGQVIMLRQVLSTLRTLHELHRARSAVVLNGREHTVTHAVAPDGIDEALEGVVGVGTTAAAMAVQQALANRPEPVPRTQGADTGQSRELQLAQALGAEANLPPAAIEKMADLDDGQRRELISKLQNDLGPQRAQAAQEAAAKKVDPKSRAPQDWKTAKDPMTGPQRWTITNWAREQGINPTDIEGWSTFTKADASDIITTYISPNQKGREQEKARTVLLAPEAPAGRKVDARTVSPGVATGGYGPAELKQNTARKY